MTMWISSVGEPGILNVSSLRIAVAPLESPSGCAVPAKFWRFVLAAGHGLVGGPKRGVTVNVFGDIDGG
jgi:hypothetical protein